MLNSSVLAHLHGCLHSIWEALTKEYLNLSSEEIPEKYTDSTPSWLNRTQFNTPSLTHSKSQADTAVPMRSVVPTALLAIPDSDSDEKDTSVAGSDRHQASEHGSIEEPVKNADNVDDFIPLLTPKPENSSKEHNSKIILKDMGDDRKGKPAEFAVYETSEEEEEDAKAHGKFPTVPPKVESSVSRGNPNQIPIKRAGGKQLHPKKNQKKPKKSKRKHRTGTTPDGKPPASKKRKKPLKKKRIKRNKHEKDSVNRNEMDDIFSVFGT
mmetsp:Transcript_3380/g.7910  ORF Transcript_3380/g.7910 Transcript_3380/m.7910 type:complete len:267 (-) Transcript_3380:79-879(-)